MKHWRLKNKPYETFDDTRDRLGIKLYKVKVEINDTQFWEVEAESEQDARKNYRDGKYLFGWKELKDIQPHAVLIIKDDETN